MKKSKILALTLSAISTGILISCAKPADNTGSTDKEKPNAEPTDKKNENSTDSQASKATETNTDDTASTTTEKTASVKAIELPPEQTTAYLKHVSKDIIIPTYQNSAVHSKALHDKVVEMCKAGTENTVNAEQITELRKQWLEVAEAWAKAEAVNYGPAYESMANLYINYFPDERGLVNKSVKTLIADNPKISPKQFVDESAIVQGVPALEDILYTNDTLDESQCNYLVSSSSELNRRLSDIASHWEKEGDTLLDTADPVRGMNQYFNGLLFHIENLKSTGIDKPLAINSKQKGHVPAYIAGQSKAIVTVKLDILQTALQDAELNTLVGDNGEAKKVMTEVTDSLKVTQEQLSSLPNDISKADKAELTKLHDNLTTITKHIKRGVMPLFNVQLGFNSTDGD